MSEMTTIEASIEVLDVDERHDRECWDFGPVNTAVQYVDWVPSEVTEMCHQSRPHEPKSVGSVGSPALTKTGLDARLAPINNRLPIKPLMEAVGLIGASEFAQFLGVSRWTVLRLKKSGITGWQADEFAVKKVGIHPLAIWGPTFNDPRLWKDESEELKEAA